MEKKFDQEIKEAFDELTGNKHYINRMDEYIRNEVYEYAELICMEKMRQQDQFCQNDKYVKSMEPGAKLAGFDNIITWRLSLDIEYCRAVAVMELIDSQEADKSNRQSFPGYLYRGISFAEALRIEFDDLHGINILFLIEALKQMNEIKQPFRPSALVKAMQSFKNWNIGSRQGILKRPVSEYMGDFDKVDVIKQRIELIL